MLRRVIWPTRWHRWSTGLVFLSPKNGASASEGLLPYSCDLHMKPNTKAPSWNRLPGKTAKWTIWRHSCTLKVKKKQQTNTQLMILATRQLKQCACESSSALLHQREPSRQTSTSGQDTRHHLACHLVSPACGLHSSYHDNRAERPVSMTRSLLAIRKDFYRQEGRSANLWTFRSRYLPAPML